MRAATARIIGVGRSIALRAGARRFRPRCHDPRAINKQQRLRQITPSDCFGRDCRNIVKLCDIRNRTRELIRFARVKRELFNAGNTCQQDMTLMQQPRKLAYIQLPFRRAAGTSTTGAASGALA